MTSTTTTTLGDELDRLDAQATDIANQLAAADRDSHGAKLLAQDARDIEQAGKGVAWLCEEYGEDATVELRAMTAGWHSRVNDLAGDMGGSHGTANVYAAAGIADAPFITTEGDDDEALKQAARTIADLPVGVRAWAEQAIEYATYGETGNGGWTPLSERLGTALSATSANESE